MSLQHVSVQLIGLFAEVEKKSFSRHVATILPILEEMLQTTTKSNGTEENKTGDKSLYNAVNCLVKIFNQSDLLANNGSYINQLGHMCGELQPFVVCFV